MREFKLLIDGKLVSGAARLDVNQSRNRGSARGGPARRSCAA